MRIAKLKPVRFLDKAISVKLRSGLLLLGFLGGVAGALAQGVLTPPSEIYERPASSFSFNTNLTGGIPPLAGSIPQTQGPFQLGPVDFHPHLLYRFIYGDGIPAGPTNHLKTAIQEVSPGLLLDIGDHWSLNYTPTIRLYSNNHLPDGTDELVELLGQTSYNDWGFHLSQTYSSSSTPLLETEALTKQENYMTMFQVGRQLNSQLSAQLGLNQSIRSSSIDTISQDIHEWSASPALNYQFWSRFGVGLTGALGYDEVSPGASMKFEQAQGTMNWLVGEKLTMTAGAGVEIRQLMGSELVNPIYSGTITYRPWEQTAASLTASRTVMPSFFQNEVLVDTTVSATFQQRFLEHFNFELSGSYSTMPFVGFARVDEFTNSHQAGTSESTATVQENRKDNSRSVRVSLGSEFRQRGAISIFYSYSDTTSGLSAFALSSTQFGIEIGWRY